MTFRAFFAALLVAVALAACGGGGGGGGGGAGGGDQQTPPPPQAQSISFANAGPVNAFLDDAAYSNPASGGAGTGAITYTSSMPSVAKVDANTGQVTIIAVGDVAITASKAADANYETAQASYSMHIAPRTVGINAWIGSSDTEVSFLSDYLEMDFTRSTDLACDPKNYSVCSNGTQTSLSGAALMDSVATLQTPTAYWLKYGSNVTEPIVLPEQKFGAQMHFGSAALNGRHWLVTGNFEAPNQVWSSADGSNWRLENAGAVSLPDQYLLACESDHVWDSVAIQIHQHRGIRWSRPLRCKGPIGLIMIDRPGNIEGTARVDAADQQVRGPVTKHVTDCHRAR